MRRVLRFTAYFFIIILLFVACEKQEFLSGTYQEQQGMRHSISFTGDRFCYNDTLSGTYNIRNGVITLQYDDGVIDRYAFEKAGDAIGDDLWMDSIHYVKIKENKTEQQD